MSMAKNASSQKKRSSKSWRRGKINGVKATLEKYAIYPATFYSWRKKYESMGEEAFTHGMTPGQLKEIRRLEKENDLLKQIIAEKELESKLKDDLLKKKYPLMRKKEIVMQYIAQGMKRDTALTISGVSKHHILLQEKTEGVKSRAGRPESTFTMNNEGLPIPKPDGGRRNQKERKHCEDTNYGLP